MQHAYFEQLVERLRRDCKGGSCRGRGANHFAESESRTTDSDEARSAFGGNDRLVDESG